MTQFIRGGIMVPHPPMIVPRVGRGSEKSVEEISRAYQKAAEFVRDLDADTVVVISPHAPAYYDYIQISRGEEAEGDLGQFGDYEDSFAVKYDTELAYTLEGILEDAKFPAGTLGEQNGKLDHGTMVPLYFLQKAGVRKPLVRIGIGGLSVRQHYRMGMYLREACEHLRRKIAIVASGDLSHCQKESGPYGYKPCGPEYDRRIMEDMGKADFGKLLEYTEKELDEAEVCGHKSFAMMAGAMDGYEVEASEAAHSAVTGVGYGVCRFTVKGKDPEREFYRMYTEKEEKKREEERKKEDPYVRLARQSVEHYVTCGRKMDVPSDVPQEILRQRAGAFVSLHKFGSLRGCIGTILPVRKNLAEEIVANAVSACSEDPRFPAVRPDELEDLDISVDVLGKPEKIDSLDMLEVHTYGVIVTKGLRRGLLLPDLEGVDTVEEQVRIARQKAGLDPDEEGCEYERFRVVRHS